MVNDIDTDANRVRAVHAKLGAPQTVWLVYRRDSDTLDRHLVAVTATPDGAKQQIITALERIHDDDDVIKRVREELENGAYFVSFYGDDFWIQEEPVQP